MPVTIAAASEREVERRERDLVLAAPCGPSGCAPAAWSASCGVDDATDQRRVDEGRREAVDADAVRRELHRHRLGQPLDAVLGHAVDAAIRRADMTHLRSDVEDHARRRGARARACRRTAACATTKPARRFKPITGRGRRRRRRRNGGARWCPALLTTTSSAVKRRRAGRGQRRRVGHVARAARAARPPASPITAAVSSRLDGGARRPADARAGARPSSSAIARPVPLPAPVTSAVRPSSAQQRRPGPLDGHRVLTGS